MTNQAIPYAEETLGVHQAHEAARVARNDLDQIFTKLSEARDIKRDAEFRLTDREMEIASDERGKHPDMSQAQMDKHVKQACWSDDTYRELREQIGKAQDDINGLEYDEKIAEADLKIAVARMHELAGYFQYLAVVKMIANGVKEVPSNATT